MNLNSGLRVQTADRTNPGEGTSPGFGCFLARCMWGPGLAARSSRRGTADLTYFLSIRARNSQNLECAPDQCEKLYCSNDIDNIFKKLPKSYATANKELLKNVKSATQNTFLYSPETHIHNTKSGVKVRSKSEVIIADTLTKYGIPFEYEPLFEGRTEEGKRMNPDFRIKCADGYVFIWEHWGLLIEISYCMQQGKKLNAYQKNGYVVGENLILTADDDKGGCNAQTIDEIVRTKILPHMGY